MLILSINTGSSSIKFALYAFEKDVIINTLTTGIIEISKLHSQAFLTINKHQKCLTISCEVQPKNPLPGAILFLGDYFKTHFSELAIEGISNRVVHGGMKYRDSVLVNDQVLNDLTLLEPLAPLHQVFNLHGIRLFQELFPNTKLTSWKHTMKHGKLLPSGTNSKIIDEQPEND